MKKILLISTIVLSMSCKQSNPSKVVGCANILTRYSDVSWAIAKTIDTFQIKNQPNCNNFLVTLDTCIGDSVFLFMSTATEMILPSLKKYLVIYNYGSNTIGVNLDHKIVIKRDPTPLDSNIDIDIKIIPAVWRINITSNATYITQQDRPLRFMFDLRNIANHF